MFQFNSHQIPDPPKPEVNNDQLWWNAVWQVYNEHPGRDYASIGHRNACKLILEQMRSVLGLQAQTEQT